MARDVTEAELQRLHDQNGYQLKLKRLDLINCDAPFEIMQAFL